MKIDRNQLAAHESDIQDLLAQLSVISGTPDHTYVLNRKDLLEREAIDWDQVKSLFKEDFKIFERLLFLIHYRRKAELSVAQRERILTFLSIGYIYTKDVRYFNEFLHFYQDTLQNQPYWFLMLKLFFDNLTASKHHTYPLCDKKAVETFMQKHELTMNLARAKNMDTTQRIGLLGSPTFFKKIRNHFAKKGFNISCHFIPYHPNKKINFLLQNKFTFRLICLLKRIDFKFTTLNYHYKDPKITEVLKKEKLDIGFHKLGFIIKKNIIKPFKIGIINDHWAILPFVRGRSTIEYSLLLGFPVAATSHIVEEGVDSGGIISFYRYNEVEKDYSTIKQVRNHIRQEREFRAIDSIELLTRTKKPTIPNEPDKGLMFYSMHPLLEKYIEEHLLNGKR